MVKSGNTCVKKLHNLLMLSWYCEINYSDVFLLLGMMKMMKKENLQEENQDTKTGEIGQKIQERYL